MSLKELIFGTSCALIINCSALRYEVVHPPALPQQNNPPITDKHYQYDFRFNPEDIFYLKSEGITPGQANPFPSCFGAEDISRLVQAGYTGQAAEQQLRQWEKSGTFIDHPASMLLENNNIYQQLDTSSK